MVDFLRREMVLYKYVFENKVQVQRKQRRSGLVGTRSILSSSIK
jgi:hypothetical protein